MIPYHSKAYKVEKILENKYETNPIHILRVQGAKVQKYYILYTEEQNYTSIKAYSNKEQDGYKVYMKYSKKHGKQDEGNPMDVIAKYFELNGYGLVTLTKLLKTATDKNQIVPGIKNQVQEKCDAIFSKIQAIEDELDKSGIKILEDFTDSKDKFMKQLNQSFNTSKNKYK